MGEGGPPSLDHLLRGDGGVKLPDELPASWIHEAEAQAGGPVPTTLTEPAMAAGNPGALQQVVDQVKRTIFPLRGLA